MPSPLVQQATHHKAASRRSGSGRGSGSGTCLDALAHVAAAPLAVVDEHVAQLAGQQRPKQAAQLQARDAEGGGAGIGHALDLRGRGGATRGGGGEGVTRWRG